ncbi:hypothetical protein DL93DRAFT_1249633 [Clavulina sp. PMI_390]|nr:hypothetical protein DL93DRAFT_1249633 [Clavulina sp. PMI_390]
MRRLQSWTAYGFLSPLAIARLTPERFANPPPLSALLSQLIGRGKASSSSSLFCIDEEVDKEQEQDGPDYDDVCAQMQLLDVMLRDLKAFILYERAQAKEQVAPAGGNTIMSLGSVFTISTAVKPKTTLERLINELPALHERIVDGGAQNLGKTRLKNAIQNLLTRLAAQHKSITDAIRYQAGAPARMSLESHFRNSSAAAKGSPPPQILIDDDEDEDEL